MLNFKGSSCIIPGSFFFRFSAQKINEYQVITQHYIYIYYKNIYFRIALFNTTLSYIAQVISQVGDTPKGTRSKKR